MLSTSMKRVSISHAGAASLAAAALLLAGSCQDTSDPAEVNLAPFKAMARAADCADTRNRLFLVDDRIVFWDREGNCADARYTLTLFGERVSDVLCNQSDSIGGPNATTCTDETFRSMFETIISHLDDPALGLGPDHTVSNIPF